MELPRRDPVLILLQKSFRAVIIAEMPVVDNLGPVQAVCVLLDKIGSQFAAF